MKIKSLAEEARIIRHEERKALTPNKRWLLHSHRTWDVRREQRASLLAYAFIRGVPYAAAESNPRTVPNMARVLKLAQKYGARSTSMGDLERWTTDAGPCGRDPGVMTLATASSTLVASSTT